MVAGSQIFEVWEEFGIFTPSVIELFSAKNSSNTWCECTQILKCFKIILERSLESTWNQRKMHS